MGQPAATANDKVVAVDTHSLLTPPNPKGVPTPLPFNGLITGGCEATVQVCGKPVAVVGATATNVPPHVGLFEVPPTNTGTVIAGSPTVFAGGKPVARNGDKATTCNDAGPLPIGTVVGTAATVLVG